MSLIIGIDAHKDTHTAVAAQRTTAEVVGELQVADRDHGHDALLEAGEFVIPVPPKMMGIYRKAARSYGKSNPIDALAVARAVFYEPNLPLATLPGIEDEIGLLVDHRNNIVTACADDQKRLRWHMHQLAPDLEIGYQWRNHPAMLDIAGCGTLRAAQIIGEVGRVARFESVAQLASYAGVSPIPASSGRNQRHRLRRYGNRRLNRAIHIIAVTQMRMHLPAREFVARRAGEGKTSREAQRALKRYVARALYSALRGPSAT